MLIRNPSKLRAKKRLTDAMGIDTLEGGAGGHVNNQTAAVSGATLSVSEAAVTLDTCLGALSGMLAAALEPDKRGARERLDRNYETLITSLEVFREAIPKA